MAVLPITTVLPHHFLNFFPSPRVLRGNRGITAVAVTVSFCTLANQFDSPTVCELHKLLHVCKHEFNDVDMSITRQQMCSLFIGRRHNACGLCRHDILLEVQNFAEIGQSID